LEPLRAAPGVLAMSIGGKAEVRDWGDENWRALLTELTTRLPGWGLFALGAPVEAARTSALLAAWKGPSLNLCGELSIRESGAIMERARIFIGHDSGPIHLAASVGTACAAIFSARNLPGMWFPYGEMHKVFYKRTECAGCELDICVEFKKMCITAVTVKEVVAAVLGMLRRSPEAALTAVEA
jgi:ADP-heptose:LPS heptosyltransferase